MNIENMTTTEIEKYLQERKARKPKLGGTVKLAINMNPGETGWIEVVCERVFKDGSGACFYPLGGQEIDFALEPNHIIETNVPELRRRMTAAEAAEQLEVGQEVWIKCSIDKFDERDPKQPMRINSVSALWPDSAVEIEVEA